MKRLCLTCGDDISHKRIDARYCSDACRKYFSRHGSRLPERPRTADDVTSEKGIFVPKLSDVTAFSGDESNKTADKPGLARITAHHSSPRAVSTPMPSASKVMESAYRKSGNTREALLLSAASVGISALDKFLDRRLSTPAGPSPTDARHSVRPDSPPSQDDAVEVFTPSNLEPRAEDERALLDSGWFDFLGPISTPFKLLVWGPPGSGKSTFALKLVEALSSDLTCLYVADEEHPRSATFRSRLDRTISSSADLSIISRLPRNGLEWAEALGKGWSARDVVVYDSITTMGLTPRAVRSAIEATLDELHRDLHVNGDESHVDQAMRLLGFRDKTSHIWIAHAQKDGRAYLGDAVWAHNADIVVRCDAGKAATMKNRFGPAERMIEIF